MLKNSISGRAGLPKRPRPASIIRSVSVRFLTVRAMMTVNSDVLDWPAIRSESPFSISPNVTSLNYQHVFQHKALSPKLSHKLAKTDAVFNGKALKELDLGPLSFLPTTFSVGDLPHKDRSSCRFKSSGVSQWRSFRGHQHNDVRLAPQ